MARSRWRIRDAACAAPRPPIGSRQGGARNSDPPRWHRRLWLTAGRGGPPRHYPYELQVQRSELLDKLGEWAASEEVCRRSAEWCRSAGFRAEQAEAVVAHCRIRRNMGRPGGQRDEVTEALGIWESLGDRPGVIKGHVNLGLVHALEGRLEEAAAEYRTAIELAGRDGLEQLTIAATGNLAQVLMLQGKYEESIAANLQVIDLARSHGDDHSVANAHCNLGNVYFYQSRYQRAMECYRFQAALSRKFGDTHSYSVAVGNIGNVLYQTGDRQGSLACYREKLALSERLGFAAGIGQALGNIANVLLDEGDVEGAIDCDARVMDIAERSGDAELRASGCIDLGCLLQVKGDHQEALRHLDRAVDISRRAGVAYDLAMALVKRAESLLRTGAAAAARRDAEEGAALAERIADRGLALEGSLVAARADPGRGERELASLLARAEGDEQRAAVCHALHEVTGDERRRSEALELYRGLEARSRSFPIRQKIEQLERRCGG